METLLRQKVGKSKHNFLITKQLQKKIPVCRQAGRKEKRIKS
jgi:hypothetical protein